MKRAAPILFGIVIFTLLAFLMFHTGTFMHGD